MSGILHPFHLLSVGDIFEWRGHDYEKTTDNEAVREHDNRTVDFAYGEAVCLKVGELVDHRPSSAPDEELFSEKDFLDEQSEPAGEAR